MKSPQIFVYCVGCSLCALATYFDNTAGAIMGATLMICSAIESLREE
jgi:uncharacterized membrane protein